MEKYGIAFVFGGYEKNKDGYSIGLPGTGNWEGYPFTTERVKDGVFEKVVFSNFP